jgi:hypothetical protein
MYWKQSQSNYSLSSHLNVSQLLPGYAIHWMQLLRSSKGKCQKSKLLLVRGSNERNSVCNGGFGVDLSMGCGAPGLSTLAASLRRARSVSIVAGVVTPCTRVEESNGGRGEAPARGELLGLGTFLRRVVLLCCSGATVKGPTRWRSFRWGGVYPSLLLFGAESRCWLDVFMCVLVGARCGCVFFPVAVVYSSAS